MTSEERRERAAYYRIFAWQMRNSFRGSSIENERAAKGWERAAINVELGLEP